MTDTQPVNPVRAPGDRGTYDQAVTWALDHNTDSLEIATFFRCWREGNLDAWPEFYEWLGVNQLSSAQPVYPGDAATTDRERLARIIDEEAFAIEFRRPPRDDVTGLAALYERQIDALAKADTWLSTQPDVEALRPFALVGYERASPNCRATWLFEVATIHDDDFRRASAAYDKAKGEA